MLPSGQTHVNCGVITQTMAMGQDGINGYMRVHANKSQDPRRACQVHGVGSAAVRARSAPRPRRVRAGSAPGPRQVRAGSAPGPRRVCAQTAPAKSAPGSRPQTLKTFNFINIDVVINIYKYRYRF